MSRRVSEECKTTAFEEMLGKRKKRRRMWWSMVLLFGDMLIEIKDEVGVVEIDKKRKRMEILVKENSRMRSTRRN